MKFLKIAILLLIPLFSMSQTSKNFMVNDTLTADTTVTIPTSGVYSSWNVFFAIGTTSSTTSTVKVQASPDNSHWIDYPGLVTDTISSGENITFEKTYMPLLWMRFVFHIEAGQAVPVKGWYVFKKH